jgi:hypothetical protein
MKKIFISILIISFSLFAFGISEASIVAINTSSDNTRNVFKNLSQKDLFGLMIWAESRKDSSFEGKLAVGSVVLERKDFYRWGVKKIILQPKWFSPFNPDDKNFKQIKSIALNFKRYLKTDKTLQESTLIAENLLNGYLHRHKIIADYRVKHFVALKVENRWTRKMVTVAVLDGHKFMCEKVEVKRILKIAPVQNLDLIFADLPKDADRNRNVLLA